MLSNTSMSNVSLFCVDLTVEESRSFQFSPNLLFFIIVKGGIFFILFFRGCYLGFFLVRVRVGRLLLFDHLGDFSRFVCRALVVIPTYGMYFCERNLFRGEN